MMARNSAALMKRNAVTTVMNHLVLQLFLELHAAGNTLLLVTHEASIAAQCPRAIRMSDGRIVADGAGLHVAAELTTLGAAAAP